MRRSRRVVRAARPGGRPRAGLVPRCGRILGRSPHLRPDAAGCSPHRRPGGPHLASSPRHAHEPGRGSDAARSPRGWAGEGTSGAAARRPRRLLVRLGVGLVLAAGAFLVAAPGLISAWARARAEEAIGARIQGRASIAELRVGLNGKVRLAGLEVTDPGGQLVALVPEARFDLGIRSLLLGKRDVALRVTGVQVELVQGEDGRWNVEDLLRIDEAAESGESVEGEREPLPETPPDLEGRLELLGATITVRSPRSVLELRDVHLRIGLDGDAREFSVEGGARLAGGDGDAGTFLLDGALWPDARAGCGSTSSRSADSSSVPFRRRCGSWAARSRRAAGSGGTSISSPMVRSPASTPPGASGSRRSSSVRTSTSPWSRAASAPSSSTTANLARPSRSSARCPERSRRRSSTSTPAAATSCCRAAGTARRSLRSARRCPCGTWTPRPASTAGSPGCTLRWRRRPPSRARPSRASSRRTSP